MRNNLSKFTKAFTSIACFSLILISNNTELAARYLLDKDRFRNDLGGFIEAYSEINKRINNFI